MKKLNDFKNENKDLEKLEMVNTQGGLEDPKLTKTITAEHNSNWNCGDVETCIGSEGSKICWTLPLPDGALITG